MKGRYRIINVWRPIGGRVYDEPLALLDWRAIAQQRDLMPLCVKYAGHDIETLAAIYDMKHEWYYLKEQVRIADNQLSRVYQPSASLTSACMNIDSGGGHTYQVLRQPN